jgi:hypothetical protein
MLKRLWIAFILILGTLVVFPVSSHATTFDLVPPSGALKRGQDITFTININTEGMSLTSVQTGLTYDTTMLQYKSVTPGAAMTAVTADISTYGTGKILFTGTNATGFNGSGVFATVVFTIIAQSSGSTEICTLWMPDATPTPLPTRVSGPLPTSPPIPTALPVTGSTDARNSAVAVALGLFVAASGIFYFSQQQKYTVPTKVAHKKQIHHETPHPSA